jgi:hypothetical protein
VVIADIVAWRIIRAMFGRSRGSPLGRGRLSECNTAETAENGITINREEENPPLRVDHDLYVQAAPIGRGRGPGKTSWDVITRAKHRSAPCEHSLARERRRDLIVIRLGLIVIVD